MARRLQGWEGRLAAYIEACRHRPFAWGTHDCLMFAAGALRELTGDDPMGDRYRYHDEHQAAALLRDDGFDSLEAAVSFHLGPPLRDFMAASRGDVALVEHAGIKALGVVVGLQVAVPGPSGLAFVPLKLAGRCWKV